MCRLTVTCAKTKDVYFIGTWSNFIISSLYLMLMGYRQHLKTQVCQTIIPNTLLFQEKSTCTNVLSALFCIVIFHNLFAEIHILWLICCSIVISSFTHTLYTKQRLYDWKYCMNQYYILIILKFNKLWSKSYTLFINHVACYCHKYMTRTCHGRYHLPIKLTLYLNYVL